MSVQSPLCSCVRCGKGRAVGTTEGVLFSATACSCEDCLKGPSQTQVRYPTRVSESFDGTVQSSFSQAGITAETSTINTVR